MLTIQTRRNPLHARFPEIIVLAYLTILLMVSCHEVDELLDRGAERLLKEENDIFAGGKTNNYKRRYKLYNHCSERQVQILGQTVTAQGSKDSSFTNVRIETVHFHSHYGVNIIGEKTGRYLCFNKKSKIITRFSGRNPRCIFKESMSPNAMYTTFQSLFNPDWYIGFNRKGKSLPGLDHLKSRRDRCFYFTKWNHSYLDFYNLSSPGPKIHHPHKLKNYLRQQRLKRHAKWRIR